MNCAPLGMRSVLCPPVADVIKVDGPIREEINDFYVFLNAIKQRESQVTDLRDLDALASVLDLPENFSPSAMGYTPQKSGWHEYNSNTNVVCEASWGCSRKDIIDQLSRFAVPGQDPEAPVESGETYRVFTPGIPIPVGYVTTTVGEDGLAIMNKTIDGHIFHDGAIVRRAFQEIDGSWRVMTIGFGNNVELFGDEVNKITGLEVFNWLDWTMRAGIKRKLGIGTTNALPESWKSSSDSCYHNGTRYRSRSGRSRGFKNGASHVA